MAMTLKEELLIFWILCAVVIMYAARHFFDGLTYFAERMAAFSIAYVPAVLHLMVGHLR